MGEKRAREEDEQREEPLRSSKGEAWITDSFLSDSVSLPDKKIYCGLCFNPMTDPVELHSTINESKKEKKCFACKECILQHRDLLRGGSGSTLECPLCRKTVHILDLDELHEETASSLSCTATALENARNFSSITSSGNALSFKTCGACEKAVSQVFCVQCGFALCLECQSSMHSKKCFQHHEVVPLERVARARPAKCPVHDSHHLDLFCFDCQCTGCVLCCFSGEHKGHNVIPLCEAAVQAESIISEAIVTAEKRAGGAAAEKEKLLNCVKDFETAVEETCQNISQSFAQIQIILQSREEELKSQLHHKISPTLMELRNGVEMSIALETQASREVEKLEGLKKEGETVLAHLMMPFQQYLIGMTQLTTDLQSSLDTMIEETRTKLNSRTLIENIVGKFSMDSLPSGDSDAHNQFLQTLRRIGTFSIPDKEVIQTGEEKEEEVQAAGTSLQKHSAPLTITSVPKPFPFSDSSFPITHKFRTEKLSLYAETGNSTPLVLKDGISTNIPVPGRSATSSRSLKSNTLCVPTINITPAHSSPSMLSSADPQTQASGACRSVSHLSLSNMFAEKGEEVNSQSGTPNGTIFSASSLNILRFPESKKDELPNSFSRKEFAGLENVFQ